MLRSFSSFFNTRCDLIFMGKITSTDWIKQWLGKVLQCDYVEDVYAAFHGYYELLLTYFDNM